MSKMSEQEVGLRAAFIDEQWEARRREIGEYAEGDTKSKDLCDAADDWQMEQMARLKDEAGWTAEEMGAWLLKRAAKDLERLKSQSPPKE